MCATGPGAKDLLQADAARTVSSSSSSPSREARVDPVLVTRTRVSLKMKIPVSEGFSPLAEWPCRRIPASGHNLTYLGRESEVRLQSYSVFGV